MYKRAKSALEQGGEVPSVTLAKNCILMLFSYHKRPVKNGQGPFIGQLRPASRNMVRQCGAESHNHPPQIPYGLIVFA